MWATAFGRCRPRWGYWLLMIAEYMTAFYVPQMVSALFPGSALAMGLNHWFVGPLLGFTVSLLNWEIHVHRAIRPELRKLLPGRCPACGYDLRATPDRCPECGAIPPAAVPT